MKIGLLDHMGYGNLGDAATQEALIANIKARVPGAAIIGFSLNPDDTRKRHNIPCYSITNWHPGLNKSEQAGTDGSSTRPRPLRSRIKLILKKIPVFSAVAWQVLNLAREVMHLGRSFKILQSLDVLIIAGGGQLCELWRGPWSHPYNVFKFSALTKLANKQLLFLNVGAGPLNSTLSRAFAKCSVRLADYISFRDVQSQTLIEQVGVKRKTHVFPDSAYALDLSDYKINGSAKADKPLVGINPIGFCDPRIWPRQDPCVYSRYLDNLAAFSLWLLSHDYRLKIFSGEASVDLYAIEDLKARLLTSLTPADINMICVPPSAGVKDLLAEMSGMEFVVTSKFHGVIFSHLLAKPVIALSYHNKIDDLMRIVGHSEHCLNIERFDPTSLTNAFITLVKDAQELKGRFREAVASNSHQLKAQFDGIFLPVNLQPSSLEVGMERDGSIPDGLA